MTEANDIVSACLRYLMAGQSALVSISDGRRLVMTPLIDNNRSYLTIGLEGGGFAVQALDEELDKFKLVGAGFPWHISEAVAILVSELVEAGKVAVSKKSARTLTTGDSPQLENTND